MSILMRVSREHHQRLLEHVDRIPAVGDRVGRASPAALLSDVEGLLAFLNGLLVPQMEAAEAAYYPVLEQLLQNRHSMTPMRREHVEIRALVEDLQRICDRLRGGGLSTGDTVRLRRVVFRLYAMLKVHLAEEELYVGILQRGVSPEAQEAITAMADHAIVGVRAGS